MHTSIQELLTFIRQSPSPFHAVHNMELELSAAGYERLYEEDAWHLNAGGKYIVSRNGSSLSAFTLPDVLSLHGESLWLPDHGKPQRFSFVQDQRTSGNRGRKKIHKTERRKIRRHAHGSLV